VLSRIGRAILLNKAAGPLWHADDIAFLFGPVATKRFLYAPLSSSIRLMLLTVGSTKDAKALFPFLAGYVGFIVLIFSARAFLVSDHLAPRHRPHGKANDL
jgi:hypothetical protein